MNILTWLIRGGMEGSHFASLIAGPFVVISSVARRDVSPLITLRFIFFELSLSYGNCAYGHCFASPSGNVTCVKLALGANSHRCNFSCGIEICQQLQAQLTTIDINVLKLRLLYLKYSHPIPLYTLLKVICVFRNSCF